MKDEVEVTSFWYIFSVTFKLHFVCLHFLIGLCLVFAGFDPKKCEGNLGSSKFGISDLNKSPYLIVWLEGTTPGDLEARSS